MQQLFSARQLALRLKSCKNLVAATPDMIVFISFEHVLYF